MVAVARYLLGAAAAELSPEAMSRIAADLASDKVARRDVAVARSVQRSINSSASKLGIREPAPQVVGRLQLRRQGDAIELEADFPCQEPATMERLRRGFRRHRYAPRLWGVSSRVPAEQLLAGVPFAVRLTEVPAEDAPLLPDLYELDLEDDLKQVLAGYALGLKTPAAFAVGAGEDVARAVVGAVISGYRKYWLLLDAELAESLGDFEVLGKVGPLSCIELDPAEGDALDALDELGFQVRFGVSVSFAGAAPLSGDASVPEFEVGDTRVMVPRRAHKNGLIASLADEQVALCDNLLSIKVQRGEHTLVVAGEGDARTYRFRGVDAQKPTRAPDVWVDLVAPELTAQSLLAGAMSLRIDSLVPLEGLDIRLEIETAGRRVSVTAPLGALPQVLSAHDEPWPSLLDEGTRRLILQDPRPTLRVHVGSMASKAWELEQRLRSCWWRRTDADTALQSELGPLAYRVVSVQDPTARPSDSVADVGEARLLVPFALPESVHGPAAEFVTLCTAPKRLSLEAPAFARPRFLRQRNSERGAIGLEDLAAAYLRWELAESSNLAAELRRRQVVSQLDAWLAELCCGDNWARQEAKLPPRSADPWLLLFNRCRETGLGRDSYVEHTDADAETITRLALAEIRRVRPELWARVSDLDEQDYEALDRACIRAYELLAERYETLGNADRAAELAEGDIGTAAEDWDTALLDAKASAGLRGLGELLLPTAHASRLVALDFTLMKFDELRDELIRWARDSKRALAGPVPSDATLGAILALWLAPQAAVALDWRGTLDTLVAERCIARAARYIALRARQTWLGGMA